MAARSDTELLRLLTAVSDLGVAHIRKRDFLALLGRQRLTASIWRDVRDLWREMEGTVPLLIGDKEGVWAFVYGKGLKLNNESWLDYVETFAGPE